MNNEQIQDYYKYYALAAVIFIIGVSAFVFLLINTLRDIKGGHKHIIVPGDYDIVLPKPGKYTIFHEYKSVIGGKIYNTKKENLSGLKCKLVDKSTGLNIPLAQPMANSTYSIGSRSGVAILKFNIDDVGIYEFSAFYEGALDGPEVVLAIGQGFIGKILLAVFGGVGILLVTIGISITIIIFTIIKIKEIGNRHQEIR